ncbi:MAG TPA: DUF1566 domain-containing protein [bacterium]|nr:DUF1566 domain-containing protein [bacterium]
MKKILLFLAVLSLFSACDVLKLTDRGGEGDACFTDNTCKEPFECVDGVCVMPSTDTDAVAETDDESVTGDDDEEKDEKDISDIQDGDEEQDGIVADADDAAEDMVVIPDEDAADDQTDQSDSSDPSDVDDTIIVTDDTVVPDDDTTVVDDDTVVTDDAAPIDDDIVEIDDETPTDDTVATDDAVVSDDDVVPVNECVTQSNPCDTDDVGATCTDETVGYTCNCTLNYTFDGTTCAPDTLSGQACTGKPANSMYNTATAITQTWDGDSWEPSTTAAYNEESSATECRFKCEDYYYVWDGDSCEDLDECAGPLNFCDDNGDTSATCTNISPGYDCGCSAGFEISHAYPASPEYPTCVALPSLCTGQTLCYNATTTMACPTEGNDFYGQDAQYAALGGYCAARDYTVSGSAPNNTVTDNVTGLIWQGTAPSTYAGCTGGEPVGSTCTWQEAINYCTNLSYAGYDDWHLPTRKELATLLDYGHANPAIDTTAFPDAKNASYWSSSPYAPNADGAWNVSFSLGSEGNTFKTDAMYVRCVRDGSLLDSVFTEETVSSKVIVTDTVTGLQWTKEYSSSMNWQNALAYCENLNYGDATDWRLPNIEELKTLIDDTRYSPASDFPGMPSLYFWSSSSHIGFTNGAWDISFGYGNVNYNDKSNDSINYAICVR